jgi:hypothetical protein
MEVRDLKSDVGMIITFKQVWLFGFYKLCLPASRFQLFNDHIWEKLSFFRRAYVCDSSFQKCKWWRVNTVKLT